MLKWYLHAEIANWVLPECKFLLFLLGNCFLLIKYEYFFQNRNLNLVLQLVSVLVQYHNILNSPLRLVWPTQV